MSGFWMRLNDLVLQISDSVLAPLLALGQDVALLCVAVGTAAVLTIMRKFASDQDLLARCASDKKTLRCRIRSLARGTDAEVAKVERRRLKALMGRISLKALGQERWPLLLSLVPIVFLAVWAFARLAFVPPAAEEPFSVVAHFPASDIGQVVHLMPQDGLHAESGWITEVQEAELGGQVYGHASWTLHGQGLHEAYPLIVRSPGECYQHEVLVGQDVYSDPIALQGDGDGSRAVELVLQPTCFLGCVPGFLGLAPWLVAYLLITVPFVFGLKKVLRIY